MKFISLWIAFNACYADSELNDYSLTERQQFNDFISKLVAHDHEELIFELFSVSQLITETACSTLDRGSFNGHCTQDGQHDHLLNFYTFDRCKPYLIKNICLNWYADQLFRSY